jgi:RhtB (resistance to homoserine/threonine) family protein
MHLFLITFFTIASLHFLAVITPGPDFAIVTKNALVYPRRVALFTAWGIASGIAIHSTYCIFGLAWVIADSPTLFNTVKYLGAAYLIYLGVKIWWPHKQQPQTSADGAIALAPSISVWQGFKEGFLCNLLNPKATLFMLGLFTLAIKPLTPWWERAFYGIWIVLVTLLWFLFVATIITNPHVRAKIWRLQPMAVKVMGVLFIIFGLNLALWGHH